MKARAKKHLCKGTGICQSICPAIFGKSKDGFVEIKYEIVDNYYEMDCRNAIKFCPSGAIYIEE